MALAVKALLPRVQCQVGAIASVKREVRVEDVGANRLEIEMVEIPMLEQERRRDGRRQR